MKFLISKFPTGDYLNRHPEKEDDDNDDDDARKVDAARKERERTRRRGLGGSFWQRRTREVRSDDEDDGSDLDDFIVDDDEDEDLGAEDDTEEEEEEEGVGDDGAPRAVLPAEVKGLSLGQLRRLLSMAEVPHKQCTTRAHLLARVREVESRHNNGTGPSVKSLIDGLGHNNRPQQQDDNGASSSRAKRRADGRSACDGRPKRRAAEGARAVFDLVSSDDEVGEGAGEGAGAGAAAGAGAGAGPMEVSEDEE